MFVTQLNFYHFLVLPAWRKRQSKTTELHTYVRRQVVRQQRKRIFEQKQKKEPEKTDEQKYFSSRNKNEPTNVPFFLTSNGKQADYSGIGF